MKSFHLYIRQHRNGWYTAQVLTHPRYAAFGPKLPPLREQLSDLLANELMEQRLIAGDTYFEELQRQVLEVELRAVQHSRLVTVPMRFSMLVQSREKVADDLFDVWLPRLGKRFTLYGRENIKPWAEEIVRGFFHLEPVTLLLEYEYEKGERIERIDVSWNAAKAAKLARAREKKNKDKKDDDGPEWGRRSSELGRVGVELVAEARAGNLPRAHFREEALRQLIGILEGSQGRSVLLTGDSGVGKSALVHELAHHIALGRVPERLRDVPVWHVTGGRIIAGMKFLGQWQERCLEIVREIRNTRGILFTDSLLELLMAGSIRTGQNVGQFFLPYIQSGEIAVIAESSPDALVLAEQQGASFVAAFRRLPLKPFDTEQSYQILERAAHGFEREHKVTFTPRAINRALDVLARFSATGALPGSGLTLIEQMARLPKTGRERDRYGRVELVPADAITAFCRSSGFPESLIDPDQLLDTDAVRAFFTERIIGQPDATELLTNLIMVVKASLNDPERPLGSFLFMGPTGVGKTESALTLAEYLFGDRDRLLRFDMSEYGYPGSASRLVGGARGEGELTRRVREQPFSVVLLDEIEKADSEVFDILLQVLGEGRLTDGTGRTVRFTHCIVIMTSNLGAGRARRGMGLSPPGETTTGVAQHYRDAAQAFFRPEFVNRIDYLVPFADLNAPALRSIARIMLDKALTREGFLRRELTVSYEPELLELLMKHGFAPRYGARPMKQAVEQHVLVPLSRRLVLRTTRESEDFHLYVHEGRVAVVSSRSIAGSSAPLLGTLSFDHDNLFSRALTELTSRLHRWEESTLVRGLRETGDPLPNQLVALIQAIRDIQTRGTLPSSLSAVERDALRQEMHSLDARVQNTELALCLALLPRRDTIVLRIDVPSGTPRARRAANALTSAWCDWTRDQGATAELDTGGLRLSASGSHIGTLLAEEVGVHRLIAGEEESEALYVYLEDEPTSDSEVREIQADTLWDPLTETEVAGPLSDLAQVLERFIVARLCRRVATADPP